MKLTDKLGHPLNTLRQTCRRFPGACVFTQLAVVCMLYITAAEPEGMTALYVCVGLWIGMLCAAAGKVLAEYAGKGQVLFEGVLPGALAAVSAAGFILFEQTALYELMAIAGILTAALLGVLYLLTRGDEGLCAAAKLVRSFFFAAAVGMVVGIGANLCISAFSMLIFREWMGNMSLYACILILDLCVLVFLSGVPHISVKADGEQARDAGEPCEVPAKTRRISGAYRAIFMYAVLPLSFVLLAVLYLYFLKIAVTLTLPEGGMNLYAGIADVLYIFNLFSVSAFAQEAAHVRFFRLYGGLLMLPVLAMQGLAIGVRIYEYGLTVPRLLTLYLMAVTLVLALGAFFRAFGVGKALLVSALLTLVLTVTPLNFIDLPVMQQTAALKEALARNGMLTPQGSVMGGANLSAQDQAIIRSCFSYLSDSPGGKPEILVGVTANNFEAVFGFPYLESTVNTGRKYSYFENSAFGENGFDISAYSMIYSTRFYRVNEDTQLSLSFEDPRTGRVRTYDALPLLTAVMQADAAQEPPFGQTPVMLDDQTDFYVLRIQFYYSEETDTYRDVRMQGYFLLKDS